MALRREAALLLLVLVPPGALAQDVEGWVRLSDGTRLEGTFRCDRRRVIVRDVERGVAEHIPVESLRRIRTWVVDERCLEGVEEDRPVVLVSRELSAEIEAADGSWRYAPLELRLRFEEDGEERKLAFTRFARGRVEGDEARPDFVHVEEAAFGPAAAGPVGPRLAGRLDRAGGWRRVLAVRRESNLVVAGRIVEDGAAFEFPWIYPGTYDLVLVGEGRIDLWMEPEVQRGIGKVEDESEVEAWVRHLAVREEDAGGGREIRHALARGRPDALRGLLYEGRWRTTHGGSGGSSRADYLEHTFRLRFARKVGESWRTDREVEVDRIASPDDSGMPRPDVLLDRRLSGVRVERNRATVRLDLVSPENG